MTREQAQAIITLVKATVAHQAAISEAGEDGYMRSAVDERKAAEDAEAALLALCAPLAFEDIFSALSRVPLTRTKP